MPVILVLLLGTTIATAVTVWIALIRGSTDLGSPMVWRVGAVSVAATLAGLASHLFGTSFGDRFIRQSDLTVAVWIIILTELSLTLGLVLAIERAATRRWKDEGRE